MECPDCGYMLSAFDKECPRCKVYGGKALPRARPELVPVDPPHQVSLPPMPEPEVIRPEILSSAPPLNPAALPEGALSCPVCASAGTQRVTSVYRAGSWTESGTVSSGTYAMFTGGVEAVGVGVSQVQTSGVPGSARLLAPPPPPTMPATHPYAIAISLTLIILSIPVFLISLPLSIILIGIPGLVLSPIMFIGGLAGLIVTSNRQAVCRRSEQQYPRWQEAIRHWEILFYCSRCDYVYIPGTRHARPAHAMHELL